MNTEVDRRDIMGSFVEGNTNLIGIEYERLFEYLSGMSQSKDDFKREKAV